MRRNEFSSWRPPTLDRSKWPIWRGLVRRCCTSKIYTGSWSKIPFRAVRSFPICSADWVRPRGKIIYFFRFHLQQTAGVSIFVQNLNLNELALFFSVDFFKLCVNPKTACRSFFFDCLRPMGCLIALVWNANANTTTTTTTVSYNIGEPD